jgi:hypothetical protein
MLHIHIKAVEAGAGGDAGDFDAADEPHRHRSHHLAAMELVLHVVAENIGDLDRHVGNSLKLVS